MHRRVVQPELRKRLCPGEGTKLIVHVSNFRPVKRVDAVLEVFDRIRRKVPSRLLLVGDGPELATAYRLGRQLGISDLIDTVGAQEEVTPLLSVADLFLLPSAEESFGLAALEAMACEVPVVASHVGGLPEVIEDGLTGFLHAPMDLDGMAKSALALLQNQSLHRQIVGAAQQRVSEKFCADRVVPMYEDCYASVMR